ncbi:MAG: hypothetical protein KKD28_10835 [Chloroflexi bacterium]|nr:hypothetical protein [Chloroflexota bacterium]
MENNPTTHGTVSDRPFHIGRCATIQLLWEDPDIHNVTEIKGNLNTWNLAESFEQADPRYN